MDHLTARSVSNGPGSGGGLLHTPPQDPQFSTADLRSVVGVLLRNAKVLVLLPLIGLCLAYGILRVIPNTYKSTIDILVVDPKQPDATNQKALTSFEVDQAAIASEIEFITSQSVAVRAAKELGLDKDREFLTSSLAQILGPLGLSGLLRAPLPARPSSPDISAELEQAAGALRDRHLKVERQGFSYVLQISATSLDPEKAQRIATAVANGYITIQLEARYEATRRAIRWLRNRMAEIRAKLLETETAIEKLKAESGLSDTGSGSNLNLQQITDMNTQLGQARADLLDKKTRYEQVQHIVQTHGDIQTLPEVLASSVIAQLRTQKAELVRKEADLRARLGERLPEVQSVRSQIGDTNAAINAELGRILENLKNAYQVAAQREKSIRESLDAMAGQHGNSAAVIKLGDLRRTAEADRKIYESFLGMFNDIQQRSSIDQVGARVLSAATLPVGPSSPKRGIIYAVVGVLLTVIAVGIGFVREFLHSGFKTAAQVERALGADVLGTIPKLDRKELRGSTSPIHPFRRLIAAPFSRLSESVRAVRTGLAVADFEPPRVLLVSSSIPSEGKTTVALLVATSCAASKKRTLFVDCDLRRGSASELLGLRAKQGLSDVLSGTARLSDVIEHNQELGLFVVPCGAEVKDPTDLLASKAMHELLQTLRQDFHYVILDSAPVLPVADALVLAKLADRLIFVVEWSKTPRGCVVDAIKRLPPEARRIGTIVLNKADFKQLQSYGYGYGADYTYGKYYKSFDKYYAKS